MAQMPASRSPKARLVRPVRSGVVSAATATSPAATSSPLSGAEIFEKDSADIHTHRGADHAVENNRMPSGQVQRAGKRFRCRVPPYATLPARYPLCPAGHLPTRGEIAAGRASCSPPPPPLGEMSRSDRGRCRRHCRVLGSRTKRAGRCSRRRSLMVRSCTAAVWPSKRDS